MNETKTEKENLRSKLLADLISRKDKLLHTIALGKVSSKKQLRIESQQYEYYIENIVSSFLYELKCFTKKLPEETQRRIYVKNGLPTYELFGIAVGAIGIYSAGTLIHTTQILSSVTICGKTFATTNEIAIAALLAKKIGISTALFTGGTSILAGIAGAVILSKLAKLQRTRKLYKNIECKCNEIENNIMMWCDKILAEINI